MCIRDRSWGAAFVPFVDFLFDFVAELWVGVLVFGWHVVVWLESSCYGVYEKEWCEDESRIKRNTFM